MAAHCPNLDGDEPLQSYLLLMEIKTGSKLLFVNEHFFMGDRFALFPTHSSIIARGEAYNEAKPEAAQAWRHFLDPSHDRQPAGQADCPS